MLKIEKELWDIKNKNKNNYFMRETMGYKRLKNIYIFMMMRGTMGYKR